MLKLICCVDIKSGDKIECEKANIYNNRFLFVEENGKYHTYRLDRIEIIDDLSIVSCGDKKFYLKEEPDLVTNGWVSFGGDRPISEFNPEELKNGDRVMLFGYDDQEDCYIQESFLVHRNKKRIFFENEDGYPLDNLDDSNVGYRLNSFKICK